MFRSTKIFTQFHLSKISVSVIIISVKWYYSFPLWLKYKFFREV